MTQWYYATQDNQQCGPVNGKVILEKLRNNELSKNNLVWCEGMTQWQRLETKIGELKHLTNELPVTQISAEHDVISATENRINDNPNPETAPFSPYTAPASDLVSHAIVRGGEVIYAGFWRRAAACLIDGLLINTVAQILGGLIGLTGAMMSISEMLIFSLSFLVGLGIGVVYYAWFHSSDNAATPGKMLVGIKVVRPDGERITFLRGVGRFFATYISQMIMCIGYIMAAFTDHKQALHDMMCDTWVVDKWAFTDRPQLQQRGLGTATVVILSIFSILFAIAFIFIIIAIGVAIANS